MGQLICTNCVSFVSILHFLLDGFWAEEVAALRPAACQRLIHEPADSLVSARAAPTGKKVGASSLRPCEGPALEPVILLLDILVEHESAELDLSVCEALVPQDFAERV